MAIETDKLEGFTATITKTERFEKEFVKQISSVKLKRNPFRLYLRQEYPDAGVEILIRPDHSKALVNLNSFPWVNLHLDPYGSIMRRQQHHTVYDSGFDLMTNLLVRELDKIGSDTAGHLSYLGTITYDDRTVHELEFNNPSYQITIYAVGKNESVIDIVRKLNVNEYYILELNENLDFYDDTKEGQIIRVPTHYASKITLYLDVEYLIPLVIRTYDLSGLYEEYAYRNFRINPPFKDEEFSSSFDEYGF